MGQGLCLPRRGLSAALEWDDLAAEPLPGGPAGTPLRASLRKSKAQLHSAEASATARCGRRRLHMSAAACRKADKKPCPAPPSPRPDTARRLPPRALPPLPPPLAPSWRATTGTAHASTSALPAPLPTCRPSPTRPPPPFPTQSRGSISWRLTLVRARWSGARAAADRPVRLLTTAEAAGDAGGPPSLQTLALRAAAEAYCALNPTTQPLRRLVRATALASSTPSSSSSLLAKTPALPTPATTTTTTTTISVVEAVRAGDTKTTFAQRLFLAFEERRRRLPPSTGQAFASSPATLEQVLDQLVPAGVFAPPCSNSLVAGQLTYSELQAQLALLPPQLKTRLRQHTVCLLVLRNPDPRGITTVSDSLLADLLDAQAQHLDLRKCPFVTDRGLAAVGRCAPNLRSLSLDRRHLTLQRALEFQPALGRLTDSGVCHLAAHCASLTHVDLAGCSHVGDVGVCALVHGAPALSTLVLDGLAKVTDLSLLALGSSSCRALRHLSLRQTQITTLAALCRGAVCPLESLDVAACPRLRPGTMALLGAAFGRTLQALSANETGLSEATMDVVLTTCPRLWALSVRLCLLLSPHYLMAVRARHPHLALRG